MAPEHKAGSMSIRPFHLAAPISNIETARTFYVERLGAIEGRSTQHWIDFNFFGHQLSLHVKPQALSQTGHSEVDGQKVPVRHFGVVLTPQEWNDLATRLTAAGTDFIIAPYTRFKGLTGEQSTMFFLDPDGNALEFKAFADHGQIFAS